MHSIQKIARITGRQNWSSLNGRKVLNRVVHITNCGDIQSYPNGPIFKYARTVFMDECTDNFVYHWLNEYTFPHLEEVYLSSHPCEPDVLWRFSQSKIYLDDRYLRYKQKWAGNLTNVITLPSKHIETMLGLYEEGELFLDNQEIIE